MCLHTCMYERRLIVGNHPLGVGGFQTEVWRREYEFGPTKQKSYREFLRWPEFTFPPPHLSVHEPCPQGVVSYDKVGLRHI